MPKKFGFIILGILVLTVAGYIMLTNLFSGHTTETNPVHLPVQKNHIPDADQSSDVDNSVSQKDQDAEGPGRDIQRKGFQTAPQALTPKAHTIKDKSDTDTMGRALPPGMTRENIPIEFWDNPGRFYERLEEVQENEIEENETIDPIFFSTLGPDRSLGLPYIRTSFSPFSIRIFASFASTTENMRNRHEILAKWYNADNDIILYEYFQIIPEANYNYVWKEMDYWDTGIYHVEFFSLEDNIKLLASGSFVVDSLDTYVSYLGTYPSPEKAYPESDFYGDDEIYVIFNHSNETDRYLWLSIYRIESRDVLLNDEVLLPASQNALFRLKIKASADKLAQGSYGVLLLDKEHLVGRSRFYINE